MKKGRVKFFDPKRGFGKIDPDDGSQEVFVHCKTIADESRRYLAAGEPVEFDSEASEKGPATTSVSLLEIRHNGCVDSFNSRRGFGTILQDDTGEEHFVHYSEIVSDKGFKNLEEGQDVTFVARIEEGGKRTAKRVLADLRMPLERFAILSKFEDKLADLATLAQREEWEYREHASPHPLPVLWSFIHYTFKRLKVEGKIAETVDEDRGQRLACFNTNLVTHNFETIYAAFHENAHEAEDEKFVLIGFFKESQHPITLFEKRPDAANFFTEPAELVYDRSLELVCNVDHVVEERMDRFPEHYHDKPGFLATGLSIAIDRAKRRVLQNYKTAIPMFNRGRIQLLLPLCLDSPTKADVALVVGREGRVYKGYTVLTLDMAYNNARLLTKPDREWLVP